MLIPSNIVPSNKVKEVHLETLRIISEAIKGTYGPMGSNAKITEMAGSDKILVKYSKDGFTNLKSYKFKGAIEESVLSDLIDITGNIATTIGDGTTAATIMTYLIYKALIELNSNKPPVMLTNNLKAVAEDIKTEIRKNAIPFTPELAYKIAMISTNGNEIISQNIKSIYEEYGNDVYIEWGISNTEEHMLKTYDGMTLDSGYSDVVYVNNAVETSCDIRNANIYSFQDPIDTVEMISLLNGLITHNILNFYKSNVTEEERILIPTVIIAPHVSRDAGAYITQLIQFMHNFDTNLGNKPPFLLINNVHQIEQLDDICRLCGCKPIKKYINLDQQKKDEEQGIAATPDTVWKFAGKAELVSSNLTRTKFVNPDNMHNEDGTLSEMYTALISFTQAELKKAREDGEDLHTIGNLKRRINSLKCNMVEYLVGGVSVAQRDSVKDLLEDAILNCRSAAINGVGYAANYEGLMASIKVADKSEFKEEANIIKSAYEELLNTLYGTKYDLERTQELVENTILNQRGPVNMKTDKFDQSVLSSIESDIAIMEAVVKIVSLMYTCNQFITPQPEMNKYGVIQ